MNAEPLLSLRPEGLYCDHGDFFVDPWAPVERAVITHAHGDHARPGCASYLAAAAGFHVLRARLGDEVTLETAEYGQTVTVNGVHVSLHPAGHILGSAQVRIEHRGQVWVVSGDYKVHSDLTCAGFEPVRCHTFVTESTFALPIYRWPEPGTVFGRINGWWRANQELGKPSLLIGYALGKAQRLLAGIDTSLGPIYTHGAVERMNEAYRASGVALPATVPAVTADRRTEYRRALILAPPSAHGSPWRRRFGAASAGLASGWMRIRGARRRRALDRGFVLSDHADWPGLLDTIHATGAERVWVTHGYAAVLARWLRERGFDAQAIATRFEGERVEVSEAAEPHPTPEETAENA